MNNPTSIRGYKVFNPDMTCRSFKFEVGKEYKHNGEIEICKKGFHFCVKASHCFSYYDFNSENKVCEVEAVGQVLTHQDDSKICTDHIRIIRELTWQEVLQVANDGKDNTGHSNTGDWNTGDRNTGDRNTGDRNTGNRNTGNWNTGYSNTGDRNTGNWNTGYRNTGYRNTGDRNTGYRNTGDRNTGYSNTGDRNTGNWNTGYSNTGDRNTGDWNTGDRNTGYSNTGDRNGGVFCTGEKTIKLFDKDSSWSEQDFIDSKAYSLLCQVDTKMWVYPSQMNDEEKKNNPSYQTCDGYLKDIPFKEAFQNAWHNWNAQNREAFTSLPNFDKDIFFLITGVKI
jgi:PPE-repeat protein